MLGQIGGKRSRGQPEARWIDLITAVGVWKDQWATEYLREGLSTWSLKVYADGT